MIISKQARMKESKLMPNDVVLLGNGSGARVVRVGDISSVEISGNYMSVRTSDGQSVTARGSLASCEERFPASFFRAGRNHFVNLAEVAKANMATRKIELEMKDGTLITMSRIASTLFRKQFSL